MPISNEKKIKKLLALMDEDSMTNEEFLKAFQQVVDFVKRIDARNLKESEARLKELKDLSDKLELKNNDDFANIKDKLKKLIDNQLSTLEKLYKLKIDELDIRISQIKDGKDGKDGLDADDKKIIKKVLKKIPKEKTAEDIRDMLEYLGDEERLEISAINGLTKKLEKLESKIGKSSTRVLAGPSANAVLSEDLTSQCNGVAKSFTVPRHRKVIALLGTQFPIVYRPTTDFTTSNMTLTLTSEVDAPKTGQTLTFLYVK